MKKFAICTILVLGVILYSGAATPAQAICIHFTNFCDQIQVAPDSYGNIYGVWGWLCDSVTLTNILGRKKPLMLTTRPVFSSGFAYYYTFEFLFNQPSPGYFNMYGTDGSVSFPVQLTQPWTKTSGACTFAGANKASLVGKKR
jgi:hypothetical protein